ncbi:uncharacterized protein [Battus philenor]|uniref:uncharacterized protein n=1 Tax=Battus philenor TaxID=42288 RepID=UPI0035D00412
MAGPILTIYMCLLLCSLTRAAYISRMTNVNRLRAPSVFRPGGMLRPWMHQRIVPAASHRAPYVVYRGPLPHRYAIRPYAPNVRNVFTGGPWKTGRLPLPATTEYGIVRAASAPPVVQSHGGTGAIHTIPAPNLSLSEKPIVVVDTSESSLGESASEVPKTTYEVTEKYAEPQIYQMPAKIENPTGFSKTSSLTTPELQQFVPNGASFPLSSQYGVPSVSVSQNNGIPQQFSLQGFTELSGNQDLVQTAAEGIIIPPSALYQSDPNFLHNLQNHLLQQFPAIEFIPYPAEIQSKVQQSSPQPELFLLQNEVITQKTPITFKTSETHRNIVQRETQEGSFQSLMPQAFIINNVTENLIDSPVLNRSHNLETTSEPPMTTPKHTVETSTEEQKTTPLYYAQVGQSVGDIIAKGFYSAINDVRVAAVLEQMENSNDSVNIENVTTVKPEEKTNITVNEINNNNDIPLFTGAPFEKSTESIEVPYTLQQDETKTDKDSNVFTGQLVQVVNEDRNFNKDAVSWQPPLRLFAIPQKKLDNTPQKLTVVKAKIPPKSKLTFDDKTGEPVLRIYASYSENPLQKEVLLSKLSNMKHFKEVPRKQDTIEGHWKAASTKAFDKNVPDTSQVSQFGLKLRSRSDDYIPLFEDYDE